MCIPAAKRRRFSVSDNSTISSRARGDHPWRPIERRRPKVCKLGCPSNNCTATIKNKFTVAEYNRPVMRLAIHEAACALGWEASEFREKLIDDLARANVHFWRSYFSRDVEDLDLSPLESEKDGYEIDAENETEALNYWLSKYVLRTFAQDTLPEFHGIGKKRFFTIASAMIGIDDELEQRLIEIANAENPSPME